MKTVLVHVSFMRINITTFKMSLGVERPLVVDFPVPKTAKNCKVTKKTSKKKAATSIQQLKANAIK
jgi:hypothetical protein